MMIYVLNDCIGPSGANINENDMNIGDYVAMEPHSYGQHYDEFFS